MLSESVVVLLRHYRLYYKYLTVVRRTVGAANVTVIKEEYIVRDMARIGLT
jgi:hypothetical protein